jgi:hypothetical protein
MSSDKPTKSLPAGARGPGGGRGPMSTNKKNGVPTPGNSNGGGGASGQPTSSDKSNKSLPAVARGPGGGRGPTTANEKNAVPAPEKINGGGGISGVEAEPDQAGAPYVKQGRRNGKRNASGSSKTGLTPKAKAKYSGSFVNGQRVPPSPEEEMVAREAEEAEAKQRNEAVANRPKIRGLKKNKQPKKPNHAGNAGKLPSKITNSKTNSNSVEGQASQNAGSVAGSASQPQPNPGPSGQQNSTPAPKAQPAPKAVTKESTTWRPTGGPGVEPTITITNFSIPKSLESPMEATARLDQERRSISQPPTTEREVAIAAELLELQTFKDEDEQVAQKKPSYATKVKESTEGIHSVLYLYSGVKDRIDLSEETFNQVITAIEDKFMRLAVDKVAFSKWKWFSWSENRGLIAVASEEDSNQFINIIKNIRIPGSEQTFKLWKISDFEERHLVTVTISNGLARLGAERLIDALVFQNSLSGKATGIRVELDKNGKDWTLKFFSDKEMWWILLQMRGEGQGRKLLLDLGGGDVQVHLSRDPGVAIREAEERALAKAKATVAKAKARAEAKAARDAKPTDPDATDPPKEELAITDGGAMDHSGAGAGAGGANKSS